MYIAPYKGEKPFIFISYAHRDMERVMPILERMAQMKCRMWYDEGIDPGTEWAERIAAHVEACDCMLAFLSPNYIASENCKDELDYARDLLKERILVYLEPTKLPRGMAMRLNRIQAIYQHQYSNQDRFYERLMEAPMIIRNRDDDIGAPAPPKRPVVGKTERIEFDNGYYEGEVVDGKRTGKGVYVWTSGPYEGDRYEGDFVDGKHTGKGVYVWANGERYEGDFVDGKLTGKGVLVWTNGNRYEGDFVDGKRTGKGVFVWANGGRYEGDFVDGYFNGKGKIWKNGNRYEGDFVDGKRTGKGVFVCANGDRYEGDFVDDKRTGKGVLVWKDGRRYEGDFVNGQLEGNGTMTYPDGTIQSGRWENSKFIG